MGIVGESSSDSMSACTPNTRLHDEETEAKEQKQRRNMLKQLLGDHLVFKKHVVVGL